MTFIRSATRFLRNALAWLVRGPQFGKDDEGEPAPALREPEGDPAPEVPVPPRMSHKTARVFGADPDRDGPPRSMSSVQADVERVASEARERMLSGVPIPRLETVTVYALDRTRKRAVPVVRFVLAQAPSREVHPIGVPSSIQEVLDEVAKHGCRPEEGEPFLHAVLEAYPEDTASAYGALFAKPVFEPIPAQGLA